MDQHGSRMTIAKGVLGGSSALLAEAVQNENMRVVFALTAILVVTKLLIENLTGLLRLWRQWRDRKKAANDDE